MRNTKWLKNGKLRRAILSAFYNISQQNVGILLILWCSFKLWWNNFCLDLTTSKFCSLGNRSIQFLRSYCALKATVSILHVGGVKIYCGLLPTRFSSNFVLNSTTVKKYEISNTFLTKMNYIIWKLAKHYIYKTFKWLPGFSSSSSSVMGCRKRVFRLIPRILLRDFGLFFTFGTAITRKPLYLNVLYVVFCKLSKSLVCMHVCKTLFNDANHVNSSSWFSLFNCNRV